ncbi:HNH endonuclease [Pantoea ananatis]|uniref:HNH endonuclease n=2 Tax=Pantoea ananas TaxID=553 RepID=UPI000907282A|nr:HNH endonuclease [Pantoea ananatis]
MKCILCDVETPRSEFSLEHIFPQSLGGALCSGDFKTRLVCRKCNSRMGLFVDAMLTKTFHSQNNMVEAAFRYFDPENLRVMPLSYLGHIKNLDLEDCYTCELWVGPIGGLVYHRREVSNSNYDFYAGGNPIDFKKNGGEVYIFNQHQNDFWNIVFLVSTRDKFRNSKLISGNFILTEEPDFFAEPSPEEQAFLKKLQSIQGKELEVTFKVLEGYEQRFLCKFALAYGFNRLGNEFITSKYAVKLRGALWAKGQNNRDSFGVMFSGLHLNEDKWEHLAWIGVHTITLLPLQDKLLAIIYLFGRQCMTVVISDEPSLWQSKVIEDEVYVICPQLNVFAGPYTIEKFSRHRNGKEMIPDLRAIDIKEFDVTTLPTIYDLLDKDIADEN